MTLERATSWCIVINNPTEKDMNPSLPAKWVLSGQIEKGDEGTVHYQAVLTTPQVRFSAVKKVLPRAHIEVARNKTALNKYSHKENTRLAAVPDKSSTIPTLFDYNHTIAKRFNMDEFNEQCEKYDKVPSEHVLDYVDSLVAEDIEKGVNGVEFIAINPMWRSSWKKFWRSIVKREKLNPTVEYSDVSISFGLQSGEESIRAETQSEASAEAESEASRGQTDWSSYCEKD